MTLVPVMDCHYPGLDSFPVGPNRRVYIAARSGIPWSDHGVPWRIAAHQHAYDITLTALEGKVCNVEVELGRERGRALFVMDIQTKLRGGVKSVTAEVIGTAGPYRLTHTGMLIGKSIRMPAERFHTMWCERGAAWLVEEGEYRKDPYKPLALSPTFDIADYSDCGLYKSMPEELRQEYAARFGRFA